MRPKRKKLKRVDLAEVAAIVNEVGTTWKVKRALLRAKWPNFTDEQIQKLVPEDQASDY